MIVHKTNNNWHINILSTRARALVHRLMTRRGLIIIKIDIKKTTLEILTTEIHDAKDILESDLLEEVENQTLSTRARALVHRRLILTKGKKENKEICKPLTLEGLTGGTHEIKEMMDGTIVIKTTGQG